MKSIAIIRGKFLNNYEMQTFRHVSKTYSLHAFSSLFPIHTEVGFPVTKLVSPMDLPDFPYKMPLLNRLYTDAQYLYGLKNKLKGFDLVHTAQTYYHYTKQALDAKKQGYVKKVIATEAENIPFNNEGIWGRKHYKQYARENLDHIIALTSRTKDMLVLEGMDEKKITIIGLGVDTTVFTPSSRQTLYLTPKKITLLFAGRLEKEKGIYELLYALFLLVHDKDLDNYHIELIFAGEGSEKRNVIHMIRKLNLQSKIRMKVSSYDMMPTLYQEADIFIAPSKGTQTGHEQYCMALLEAQATGLPIITTYHGGIPENVGDVAFMVAPGDFTHLYVCLKHVITHPSIRFAFGKKARERALRVHDSSIIAKQIAEVYRKVLYE